MAEAACLTPITPSTLVEVLPISFFRPEAVLFTVPVSRDSKDLLVAAFLVGFAAFRAFIAPRDLETFPVSAILSLLFVLFQAFD